MNSLTPDDRDGQVRSPQELNKIARITNLTPHYSNERFKRPRTVWIAHGYKLTGEYVAGVEYNYSDRLQQWNWSQFKKGCAAADSADLPRTSAAWLERYLQVYFDNPALELVHVMAGFNLSNGFPYQVFGYIAATRASDEGVTE